MYQEMTYFAEKKVGESDAIHGELDSIPFYLYGMKEPDYMMQIMVTYRTLEEKGQEKKRNYIADRNKKVTSFVYPKVVHNHYTYRDMIDNHKSQRMHPISMEETWMTTHWPNHIFCFLLAVTVVNVQNAEVYFCGLPKVDMLKACKLIAQQRIENKYARTWEESPSK